MSRVSSLSGDDEVEEEDEGVDGYRKGGYHAVRPGDLFAAGRFVAQRKLGWGNFSTVWLAYDVQCQVPSLLHLSPGPGDPETGERPPLVAITALGALRARISRFVDWRECDHSIGSRASRALPVGPARGGNGLAMATRAFEIWDSVFFFFFATRREGSGLSFSPFMSFVHPLLDWETRKMLFADSGRLYWLPFNST
jgi:hypothetical protein